MVDSDSVMKWKMIVLKDDMQIYTAVRSDCNTQPLSRVNCKLITRTQLASFKHFSTHTHSKLCSHTHTCWDHSCSTIHPFSFIHTVHTKLHLVQHCISHLLNILHSEIHNYKHCQTCAPTSLDHTNQSYLHIINQLSQTCLSYKVYIKACKICLKGIL